MGTLIRGTIPDWANGSGYGSGDGDGYGYGDGDGDGDGYGSGYGYGDGDGDGSGSGYGSGDGDYWQACIKYFSAKWDTMQQARLAELTHIGAKICYWRSTNEGTPANGGNGKPVKPGDIQTESGPLRLCNAGTLHATLIPPRWKGERWWIVALKGDVVGDDEKYGALEREIIGECL